MHLRLRTTLLSVGLLGLMLGPALADEVTIEAIPLRAGIYMLTGQGGNIGLSLGEDSPFIVDDQYAPLSEKIKARIAAISESQKGRSPEVRFVVNTHWHNDHTGGNESFGESGAIIVAHENVRVQMSKDQFLKTFDARIPASPDGALPVISFGEEITFHWNGEEIYIFHVDPAHTDGDSMVLFRKANVLHMGDTYFNGFYPFIDTSTGGNIDGMIAATREAQELVNADTLIIPGHGPLSNPVELAAYIAMLEGVRAEIKKQIDKGLDLDAIVESNPTAKFDAQWGGGFLKPDVFARIAAESLMPPGKTGSPKSTKGLNETAR